MQAYMPAITMALLGGIVFTLGMVSIAIERRQLRRKAERARQESSTHASNPN
jgi:hypothetical protein